MTVRTASIVDVPSLVSIAKEGLQASIYAGVGSIDEAYARAFFLRMIVRHGEKRDGGTYFVVSHRQEEVLGYFLGSIGRTYQLGDKLTASDVHFFLSPRADRRDALPMLRGFLAFAHNIPDCVEVIVGKTKIMGDDARFGRWLERKGFEAFGTVYRLGNVQDNATTLSRGRLET